MKRTGYYSVIQYMPDIGRMEAVNLGVAIWWPGAEKCEVKWFVNVQRCQRFFPDADRSRVHVAVESVVYRLSEDSKRWIVLNDFKHFVNLLANDIQMTPPRYAALDNEKADLGRLFAELVSEPE